MQEQDILNITFRAIRDIARYDVQSYARLHAEVSHTEHNKTKRTLKFNSNCRDILSNSVSAALTKRDNSSLKCIKVRGTKESYKFLTSTVKNKNAVKMLVKHTIEKSMKTFLNKEVVVNDKNCKLLGSYIIFNSSLVNNSADFYLLLGQARWVISFLCIMYLQQKSEFLDTFFSAVLKNGELLDRTSNFLMDTFKNEKYGWACSIRGGYSEVTIKCDKTTNLVISPKSRGPVLALIPPQQTVYDSFVHELQNIFFIPNRLHSSSHLNAWLENSSKIRRINLFGPVPPDSISHAFTTPSFFTGVYSDNLSDKRSAEVEELSKIAFNLISEAIIKEIGYKKILVAMTETNVKDVFGNDVNIHYGWYNFYLPKVFKYFISTNPKELIITLNSIYFNLIDVMESIYRFNLKTKGKPLSLAKDACNLFLGALRELYEFTDITPVNYDATKSLIDNIATQWTESIELCEKVGITILGSNNRQDTDEYYNYNQNYLLHRKPHSLASFSRSDALRLNYASQQIFRPIVVILDCFFRKMLIDHEVKEVILKPSIHIKTNKPKSSSRKIAAKSRICHAAKRRS